MNRVAWKVKNIPTAAGCQWLLQNLVSKCVTPSFSSSPSPHPSRGGRPAFLQKLVDRDNHTFEEWCSEMAHMRKQSVDKGKAKHEEVKELYELLPARDGR